MNTFKTPLLATLLVAPALLHCGGGGGSDSGSSVEGSGDAVTSASNALSGNFSSSECETFDETTYQLRHYHFGAGGSTATWVRYSDPKCTADSELMTIVINGSAKVNGLSSHVLGAVNITVSMSKKTITPTAAGVAMLADACGQYTWEAGTAQEVPSGCGALFQQTDDCVAEYDLMKLARSGLVFGDRSHPLCSEETRPTALTPWTVVLDSHAYVPPGT